MTYRYCGVQVKGVSRSYSYICDTDEVTVGSYVLVPFGQYNDLKIGIVTSVNMCTEEDAPYPPERTKRILRLASVDEYDSCESVAFERRQYNDDSGYDIDAVCEVNDYIVSEQWDEVLEWAIEHDDSTNKKMIEKVIECYNLCAEQNMPVAALNLGTFYYNGIYVERDYTKAFSLYKFAADAGELRAICNVGYCYYYGRERKVDYAKAYEYFSLGALLHNDANCLYKLGDMYLLGQHVEENEGYAFKLYSRALEEVDSEKSECVADIQFRMGKCMLYGIGTEEDVMGANAYLHIALLNFYKRRMRDPFVGKLIQQTKECIAEAESLLDSEII